MVKKSVIILSIMTLVFTTGCQDTNDNRDYAPKGDPEIKSELTDDQLRTYYIGMEDTKKYLKSHNNIMGPDEVFNNLELKSKTVVIDPYAYFMGTAYYLILTGSDGTTYEDKDCGNWLFEEYIRRQTINSNGNKEALKYNVKKSFEKILKEYYPNDHMQMYIDIDDEVVGHIITGDVYYNNGEKVCYITLDISTGKVTLVDVLYN